MINEKVLQHVSKYNSANGYSTDEATIIESIREANCVWRGNESKHRWFTVWTYVVELGGMFIGYRDAESSGDEDGGYTFDPSSIKEYEPKEITVTVYTPKE